MRIIGCDLHTRQQTMAMFDTETKEVIETTLTHEGDTVREFYSALPRPALVGIEATGAMFWFLQLLKELSIPCLVGHPAAIRKAETRKQKHDRRAAALLLRLLLENRFPAIWMPSAEQRDLRHLLLHRHQLVSMRRRAAHAHQLVPMQQQMAEIALLGGRHPDRRKAVFQEQAQQQGGSAPIVLLLAGLGFANRRRMTNQAGNA